MIQHRVGEVHAETVAVGPSPERSSPPATYPLSEHELAGKALPSDA